MTRHPYAGFALDDPAWFHRRFAPHHGLSSTETADAYRAAHHSYREALSHQSGADRDARARIAWEIVRVLQITHQLADREPIPDAAVVDLDALFQSPPFGTAYPLRQAGQRS